MTYHVAVIGLGLIGRTYAHAMSGEPYVGCLTLYDVVPGLAEALKLELMISACARGKDLEVRTPGTLEEFDQADLVLVCAGSPRKPHMDRRDLAVVNAKVIASIAESLVKTNQESHIVVVTNPVDAMAWLLKEVGGFPYAISSGTFLDGVRLRLWISQKLGVSPNEVSTLVIGEHGEKLVPVLSQTWVGGKKLFEFLSEKGVEFSIEEARKAVSSMARDVIAKLGGTSIGPVECFREISKALLLNENREFTVGSFVEVDGVECFANWVFSLGRKSIKPSALDLDEVEKKLFWEAVESIKQTYQQGLSSI